ncbi:hypothetical protein PVK06_038320 [Gossypium arboreum]|uniref:Aminotransferase-like plant mobile domain-containing protein n=1 Tax=Gossypium arboreum TaxID=29729 RepID=A0ABR0N074_GOSAR|nr:hypothetical protein PVK06_038320 [Gossypium arboreum]
MVICYGQGFVTAILIWTFELRANLIFVLVERWRLETHAFHLSCRKCITTLKDVALQLGLPIDNDVFTGLSKTIEPALLCY